MPMTYFLMTFSLLVTSIYKKKSIIKNTFFSNYLNISNLVTSLIGAMFGKCYCSLSFKEMERIHLSEFINLCCEYYFILDIMAFLILLVFVKFADEKCKYFQFMLFMVKYLLYAMFLIVLLATLAIFILFLVPLIIQYVFKVSPEYHSLFETFFSFISFNLFFSTLIGVVVAVAMCKLNLCVEAQTDYKEMRFYRQYLICCNNKNYNNDINTEVMRLRGGSKTSKDSDSKLRKRRKQKQDDSASLSRSTSSVRSVGHKKTMKNDSVRHTAMTENKSEQKTATDSVKERRSRKIQSLPKSKRSESSTSKTSQLKSRKKTSESQSQSPYDSEETKKNKDFDGDLQGEEESGAELMVKRSLSSYSIQIKHPDADIKKKKHSDADIKKKKHSDADIKKKKDPKKKQDPNADLKEEKEYDANLREKEDPDEDLKEEKDYDANLREKEDPDEDLKKKEDSNADVKEKKEPDADHKKKKGVEAETKKKWDTDLPTMKEESFHSVTKDKRGSDSPSEAEKVTDTHIKSKRESSRSGKESGRKRTPSSIDKSSSNESKTSQDSRGSESGSESSVDRVKHTKYGPEIKRSIDKSPKYKMRTDKAIPQRTGSSDLAGKRSVGTWKKGSAKDKPNIIKVKGSRKPCDKKMSASDMIISERPEILTSDLDNIPSKNKKLQAYIDEPHKLKQFPDESDEVLKERNGEIAPEEESERNGEIAPKEESERKGEIAPKEESKHDDQMVKVPCPVWSKNLLPKWDSNVGIVECPGCQGLVIDDTEHKKDILKAGKDLTICKCPPTFPVILPHSMNSESESDEPKRGKKLWSSMFRRQTSKTKQKERKKETPRGGYEGHCDCGLAGCVGKDEEALVLYKSPRYPADRSRALINYQSGQKQKGDERKLKDVDSKDHLLDIQTDVVLRVSLPHKGNAVSDDETSDLACFFDPKMLPVSFNEPAQVVRSGKWRHGTFTETVSTRQALDSGELVKSMRYTKSLFKSASKRNLTSTCECATQARASDIGINVDVDIVSPIGPGIGKPVHMQLDNQLTKMKLPCDCDHCRSNIPKIGPYKVQQLDYKLRHAPSRCSPM